MLRCLFRPMVVSLLLTLTLASSAFAQATQTGNLTGKVSDSGGGVLPGVVVVLDSPSLVRPATTTTDAQGNYRFILLPLGTYELTFTLAGFTPIVHQDVPVSADKTLALDVTMPVGGIAETLTVRGGAPVVDVKSATAAVNIDRTIIDNLPTSRDIWSLLQNQAPQVVQNREDVGGNESGLQAIFSTHGSPFHQNTFMFNGINVTGLNFPGTTDLYFDYDSLEEVQISTASHKAEVGTPGVFLNVIARSATNNWHGAVQNYFSNDNMQSDNLTASLRAAGLTGSTGINQNENFTVQFGGPVVKDKLRLYGNYRYDRIKRFVAGFPLTEDTFIKAPLIDGTYQINDKNRILGTFTYNKYDKPNRDASPLLSVESTGIEDNHATVAGGNWQSTLTDRLLLDLRVGYVGQPFQIFLQPTATKPYTEELTTGQVTGAGSTGFQNRHARLQLSGYVNYYKPDWLGGSHEFKVGYDISRGPNQSLTFAFNDLNLFTLNGQPFSVLEYNTPALERELHWFYPLYAQDTFTFGRTSISAGLRYEGYHGEIRATSVGAGTFAPVRTFPAQPGPRFNNFAPRVSIVRDVFGDSKLALKGSYGRYYAQPGPHWFNEISQSGLAGRTFRWADLNGDGLFESDEQGALLSQFGGSITTLDPDMKQPHTDEWTAGVDMEAFRGMRVSALFTYRRERNLLGIVNTGVPFSAYSPVPALDPGIDGVAATADDRIITLFDQNAATLGHDQLLITNPSGFDTNFRGVELTAQKRFSNRWQLLGSVAYSHQDISALSVSAISSSFLDQERSGLSTTSSPFLNPNNLINNSGGPGFYDLTWVGKISGTYAFPYGIETGAVFKAQSGTPWNRVVTIDQTLSGAPFTQGSISVNAEPRGSRRFPAIHTLDLRAAKRFRTQRHQVEAIADLFNVTNVNTITTINGNTGSAFGSPLAILGPRVLRLGVRYMF